MSLSALAPEPEQTQPRGTGSKRIFARQKAFGPTRKVRVTVNLPNDLVEQMRDAVFWNPHLTLAWLIARAMRTSLSELHERNQGPFPPRSQPLRAGRPRLAGQFMHLNGRPGSDPRCAAATR
jgi:hypothetical protein